LNKPEALPPQLLIVALLGGECTGKTTLAVELAHALGVSYVPEALRDFVDLHGRCPTREEQKPLLMEQCRRIREAICSAARGGLQSKQSESGCSPAERRGLPRSGNTPLLILCDPSPWMTAIYSLQYFADRTLFAPAARAMRRLTRQGFAHWVHLHCAGDLPWEADGLQRDGPLQRAATASLLLRHPPVGFAPPVGVAGDARERLATALDVVGGMKTAWGTSPPPDRHLLL
jgi:nicotinamide riboside kinase